MAGFKPRKSYLHTNRYQRALIIVACLPLLILCSGITAYVVYLRREIVNLVLFTTEPPSLQVIDSWGTTILACLWIFFLLTLSWVYFTTIKTVGAFDRIIRDLDDIINGKGKKLLRVRKDDKLAQALLNRVNILIDRLPARDGAKPPQRF